MISQLKPNDFNVLSLTTIATPHRGSAFADYMFESIGPAQIKRIYRVMEYVGLETGAFAQLTRNYMKDSFNPKTPDVEGTRCVCSVLPPSCAMKMLTFIRYYSYGASLEPSSWSVFAASHSIIKRLEGGPNDGLVRYAHLVLGVTLHLLTSVSVESSQWGNYKGTLTGVSHLDLINWTNRLKWFLWELTGGKRK